MVCVDCPRKCKVDLNINNGFCGKDGKNIRIAKVMKHYWEEPIISGRNGSGAIFFSFCSLKCFFCQNYKISHLGQGKNFSKEQFIDILKKIEASGVNNINLVTPTHYTTEILNTFSVYKPKLPIVWNTSGYESDISRLKNIVDVFLFDFKYFDEGLSLKCSKAKNYFSICMNALKEARKLIPEDIIENGIMKRGIIIRHLVLPGCANDSIKIFEQIKKELGNNFYISLMSQYTPFYKAEEIDGFNRKVKPLEYKKVVNKVFNLGFNKGFIQDYASATKEYTPDFSSKKLFEI